MLAVGRCGRFRSRRNQVTGAMRAGDVLAFGGFALRGYDFDGQLQFELVRGRDAAYVWTARRWVHVGRNNSTAFTVVDARARKVVGTARTLYPTIVATSAAVRAAVARSGRLEPN
jgi:hypothetical protein